MFQGHLRRGLALSAAAAAAVLASCATEEPPAPPPPPPPPPAVALNEGVAQAASIYVAFMREAGSIPAGGFPDAESIQAAIRRGAAYDPAQLSRGMIAYGSILALQSPEFVQGVRQYAVDPTIREEMVARIIADPATALTFPGADAAAGLIVGTLGRDVAAMQTIADAVENDAYTIQERNDPRRRWAVTHIANREQRLEGAKALSAAEMLPSAEEAARLFEAANSGSGLTATAAPAGPPYTPAVVRSLALAALAALGAGGDEARPNTEALTVEQSSEFCLNMSKLMLFQCLAASRPSYEDMFCVGRHIARDLSTCTAQTIAPPPLEVSPTVVAGAEGAEPTPVAAEAVAASTAAAAAAASRDGGR